MFVLMAISLALVAVAGLLVWTSSANAAPTHQTVLANTGTIVIVKQATPADGTDFPFTSDVPGYNSFTLDDAASDDGDAVTDTIIMADVLSGAYVVNEQPPADWRIADIQCDDDDSAGTPAQGQANVVLAAGETVTCTFTNEKLGVISVRKETNPPNAPGQFTFTGALSGVIGAGETITASVAAGDHLVTETQLPAGFVLDDIACSDGDSVADVTNNNVTFKVDPGEAVTCAFTNEKPGVILEESDGESSVGEGARTPPLHFAGYTVRLNSQPTANVRIDVTVDDQVFVTKTVLTFTPSNWSVPQWVYIYAVDDDYEEPDVHFGLVNHTVSSADSSYNDVPGGYQTPFEGNRRADAINPETDGNARTVEVAVIDNDLAAVNLEMTGSSTALLEGSAQQRFYNIWLNTKPRADVTVTIQPDSQVNTDKIQLTFTPREWSTKRTVEITVVDDDDIEGPHVGQVVHAAQSGDPDYDGPGALFRALGQTGGPQPNIVQVDIIDDDYAGLIATPDRLNLLEGGGDVIYRIVLTGKPTAPVTVKIATDGQVTTDVTDLTFTPLNWNISQPVYATAVDDNDAEGPHLSNIVHTFVSTDANYATAAPVTVVADIADDDFPSVFVSPSQLTLTEGGTLDIYQVVLTTQPAMTVTVAMALDEQVAVDKHSLIFTPASWNTPQVVKVTAVDDDVDESPPGDVHHSVISHSVESDDLEYNAIPANRIGISIIDNDEAGVLVAPTSLQTSEDGSTDTYTLALNTQPPENEIVEVHILFDADQVAVTSAVVYFDHNNWNQPQRVTVAAVDDDQVEGDHTSLIRHETRSNNAPYNALPVDDVTVNIEDNDRTGLTLSPATVTVSEDGLAGTYDITLRSRPQSTVIVLIDPDAQLKVDALSLTFTVDAWDQPQSVTVSAVDDNVDEGDHTAKVVHRVVSADPEYNGLSGDDVTVNILDNDGLRVLLPLIRR
jgi:hypothetical protein